MTGITGLRWGMSSDTRSFGLLGLSDNKGIEARRFLRAWNPTNGQHRNR